MDQLHPIDRASQIVGSQAALGALLGVGKGAVHQWKGEDRRVPVEHCLAIERATAGAVTRAELRPDDYWLIWPDLPAPKPPAKRRVPAKVEA